MNSETLRELVKRAAGGDKAAFLELYEAKAKSIVYQIRKIMGHDRDTEDISQDVGIKMFQNIARLRSPELFNPWLMSIVRNECFQVIRKKQRSKTHVNIEDYSQSLAEHNKEFLPHEFAESEERMEMVMQAIDSLKPEYREALLLYFHEDMSYQEIALVMNKPVGTVSTYLNRGKKAVRRQLEKKTRKKISGAGNLAALPVLTQVLNWDAGRLASAERIQDVTQNLARVIADMPMPVAAAGAGGAAAASAAAASQAGTASGLPIGIKAVLAVTAGAVITTFTVLNIAYKDVPQLEAANQTGLVSSSQDMDNLVPQQDLANEEEMEIQELYGDMPDDPPADEDGVIYENDAAPTGEEIIVEEPDGQGNTRSVRYTRTPVSGALLLKNADGNVVAAGNLLSGITMEAYNGDVVVATTTTGQDGSYGFDGLMLAGAGSYTIRMNLPREGLLSADAGNAHGRKVVTLTPGEAMSGVDFYTTLSKAPDGTVSLLEGDCGCGHVNPARAVINDSSIISTSQSWTITRDRDGAAVYTGTGAVITEPMAELYSAGADGTYTVSYIHTDETGNSAQIKKVFCIDTGVIAPNQYE
ncbi:MAG: sigma-70 family RNA polymerase sigma factor [Christensenellaceae bacterium]|jgi:RNA polymerase sigma factor (sigma-70 family)